MAFSSWSAARPRLAIFSPLRTCVTCTPPGILSAGLGRLQVGMDLDALSVIQRVVVADVAPRLNHIAVILRVIGGAVVAPCS